MRESSTIIAILYQFFQSLEAMIKQPASTPRREARPLERKPEDITFRRTTKMHAIKQRSLLERIATVLSSVYKIIKVGIDLYTLVHFGH